MIPLESPVPEIGTPGSESGGRKRAYGYRTEARCESAGRATDPLPATRLPSTLRVDRPFLPILAVFRDCHVCKLLILKERVLTVRDVVP